MVHRWPEVQVLNMAFQRLQRGEEGTVPFEDDVGEKYLAIVEQHVLFVRKANLVKWPDHDVPPHKKEEIRNAKARGEVL